MAAGVSMRQMLEAGVHFGHQTRRWNPHMGRFIFTARNGIHILDLALTVRHLDAAVTKVQEVVSAGDQVLFIGTKKQARGIIAAEATRAGQPYVTSRWLGGTLTNFITVSKRIEYFKSLERRITAGEEVLDAEGLTKREQMMLSKDFERLERAFGGLRNMTRLPGAVFVVDPTMETNADPDHVDFPIPSNDDAIRAIQLMTGRIADAVLEGVAVGEVEQQYEAARE
jgi:small subunit ribosomal protein S2